MKYGLLRRKTHAMPETLIDAKKREEEKINKKIIKNGRGKEWGKINKDLLYD